MKVLQFSLALVAVMLFATAANATSIAVSFAGDNGGGNAINVGAGTAGIVPQGNWNNVMDAVGAATDLVDDSGAATTADVDWSSNNTWGGTSFSDADEAVVNGWLDGGGNGAVVDVASIPYTTYDVIVYYSSDAGNAGRGNAVSVNGNVKESVGAFANLNANGSYYNGQVDGDAAGDDPTYFVWKNVTGSSLNISGVRQLPHPSGGQDTRGVISGFQLVEVPEPASFVLLGLGAIGMGLVARRRS